MNRFKLLKVGDELHLVRQKQEGVNDVLKPDTLNRTNIRLDDELAESLGVENGDIQGVSKDIQLVSLVNSLDDNREVVTGVLRFINNTGGTIAQVEQLFAPLFDGGLRELVHVRKVVYTGVNNSAATRAAEWRIAGTNDLGNEVTLARFNDSLTVTDELIYTFTGRQDGINQFDYYESFTSSGVRNVIEGVPIIPTNGWTDLKFRLGDGNNLDTVQTIHFTIETRDL